MSAYMVFNYTITNPDEYGAYPAAAFPSILTSGAEVLVADYASEVKEGAPGSVTVVLRFESKEAATAWYQSPEYEAAKPIRLANSDGVVVLCDEFAMPS